MDDREFEILWRTEKKYWWFVGQRYILMKYFLNKYYGSRLTTTIKFLDIGCGAGINLSLLTRYGDAKGLDISDKAISFCKKRGLKTIKSDVTDMKNIDDESFDGVTALGVFYHKAITDDVKGFKEINRILKSGGRFFIFDCAMKSLYGKHDLAFHGTRRYSKKELKEKLEKAGFIVERISYCNTFLFPFAYIYRKLGKLSSSPPKSEVQEDINPTINKILKKMYLSELKLLQYFDYPFGINIFAVAKKRIDS